MRNNISRRRFLFLLGASAAALKALAKGSNTHWVDGHRFSSGISADAVTNWIKGANL